MKVFIGIVTNRSKKFLETMLKRGGMGSSFFDILGATGGIWNTWKNASPEWVLIAPKPAPFIQKLRPFLYEKDIMPSEVLFVGDDPIDYLAVEGSEIKFAAIAETARRREEFIALGVSEEHIFRDIKDVCRYFKVE